MQQSKTIIMRPTRQELAEYFGVQKSSLIRSFAELSDEGRIEIRGKEITLL